MFESPIFNFIFIAGISALILKLLMPIIDKKFGKKTALQKHCKNCGYQGTPKLRPSGSTFWTVFWVLFFAPVGVIYWISRYGNPVYSCPKCKSENLIDIESPILKKEA